MRLIAEWFRRLRYLLNRRRFDEELSQEMEGHRQVMEMMGEPTRFGNTLRLREEARDAWGWNWLDDLWKDLSYGIRQLGQARAFTALALITLAIGIGANTALFSVVNAVLFTEPPVRNPKLLRQIEWSDSFRPGVVNAGRQTFSYPVYQYVSSRSTAFSDVLCLANTTAMTTVNLGIRGSVQRASAEFVSGNFFQALGAGRVPGRLFLPEDDRPGAAPAAVLEYGSWQRLFGGDTAIVGQTVTINGSPFVIIGVAPRNFGIDSGIGRGDFVLPISQYPAVTRNDTALSNARSPCRMIGPLAPDVSDEQARLETEALLRQAFAENPPASRGQTPEAAKSAQVGLRRVGRGIDEFTWSDVRHDLPETLSFLFLPWAILLIPCANIAGMLLARGAARRSEIATRLALGAARQRIIRQLLTESVLLAGLGGTLGVLLCYVLNWIALAFEVPFALDIRALAFTAGLSVVTGLFFGMAPALLATRMNLVSVTKQESGGVLGRSSFRTGKGLIAVQITLSFLLLVCAGLQIRSLVTLMRPSAFEPERVLMFNADPNPSEYSQIQAQRYFQEGAARLAQLPAVLSVSLLGRHPTSHTSDDLTSRIMSVAPGYFDTMQMQFVSGRDLEWTDQSGTRKVVVVNEAYAQARYPGINPLGRMAGGDGHSALGEIVGVVANSSNVIGTARGAGMEPTVYTPFLQETQRAMWFVLRGAVNSIQLIPSVRRVMSDLDPNIPVDTVQTQADELNVLLNRRRNIVGVFLGFGLVALLQAACGIYGTLAYFVGRRTPEIGLRMALGAQKNDVIRLVIRQSLAPVVIGMGLGLLATPALTLMIRTNTGMVVGAMTAGDQLTIIVMASSLMIAAVVAAWAPAWRASRIDPMKALRHH